MRKHISKEPEPIVRDRGEPETKAARPAQDGPSPETEASQDGPDDGLNSVVVGIALGLAL
jgi:hypothetical protein